MFYNTYNILLGSIPDEEDNLHEAKALHKEFMTFNEGAVRLLQQIPMHFLNKTKGAREKIIKIMKQIDISKRVNVSDFITQVIDTDKIAGQYSFRSWKKRDFVFLKIKDYSKLKPVSIQHQKLIAQT